MTQPAHAVRFNNLGDVTRESMSSHSLRDLVNSTDGLISARVFTDPEIYQIEQERIFARTWLFVAHASEIPRPGDFVTRSMGADQIIVARGRDGQIRAFLNVCRHRGRRLCGEDQGNATHFQCGYHGWTFTNAGELTGVPFFDEYQGKLDKSALGLYQARVDTYRDLIFATWEQTAPSLRDWLGTMTWTLDLMFGRTDAVEVVGPPMRWMVDANWKLGAGNFAGDAHHLPITHGFVGALGLKPTRSNRTAYSVPTENGHVGNVIFFPDAHTGSSHLALPAELWPEIRRNLDDGQYEIMKKLQILAGNVFPNLSFLNTASHHAGEWGGPEGQAISFLSLRQWQPRGPSQMEVLSWAFVDKHAPEQWKEMSQRCYQRVFGMAGTFEQDDLENWGEISGALAGPMARRLQLHYGMYLDETPSPTWPGPGIAYHHTSSIGEIGERVFYEHWLRHVSSSKSNGD